MAFELIEVEGKHLRADILAKTIDSHGVLLVRECVPRAVALELDACARATFDQMEKPAAERDAALFRAKKADGVFKHARGMAVADGCALMVDAPDAMARTLEAYRTSGVAGVLAAYFGAAPMMSRFKATLRRTRPGQTPTEFWHQDGAFMGGDIRALNIWLALTPCGAWAASIEIACQRFDAVIPCDHGMTVSPEKARSLAPRSVVPMFEPGDALFFDHLCLHRTARDRAYPEERRALETWFFAPESYPRAYDPEPISVRL